MNRNYQGAAIRSARMETLGFRESPFLPPSRSRSHGSCHHLAFVEGVSVLPAGVPPPLPPRGRGQR